MKKLILLATTAALLTSCVNGSTPLTFTNVQAEVSAIDTAIDQVYSSLQASLPASVGTYVVSVDTASKIIEGLKSGTNVQTDIAAFSSDLSSVVAVLPIPPVTKTAIELGLAVVDAFAAGATTSPVSPTAMTTSASITSTPFGVPIVPIPVPLSSK